jgi:methionyl-tRNA synthetase
MDKLEAHHALDLIFAFVKSVNKYINDTEPWKLEGKALNNVVYNLCESLRIIAILISPFIPNASEKISEQLGVKLGSLSDCIFKKFDGSPKVGEHLFDLIQ